MKTLIFFSLLVVISLNSFSQSSTSNKTYASGKIYLKDHRIFQVKSMNLTNEDLNFQYKTNSESGHFNLNEISMVKIKKGSHAGVGALIGGGSMALGALRALAAINSDPNLSTEGTGGMIAGLIVGGTALGALIGLAVPKWKNIYTVKNKAISNNYQVRYSSEFLATSNAIGLQLKLSF